MSLAYGIDPVDAWLLAAVVIAYSLVFLGIFAAARMRERKCQASHKERLDQLRGRPVSNVID